MSRPRSPRTANWRPTTVCKQHNRGTTHIQVVIRDISRAYEDEYKEHDAVPISKQVHIYRAARQVPQESYLLLLDRVGNTRNAYSSFCRDTAKGKQTAKHTQMSE